MSPPSATLPKERRSISDDRSPLPTADGPRTSDAPQAVRRRAVVGSCRLSRALRGSLRRLQDSRMDEAQTKRSDEERLLDRRAECEPLLSYRFRERRGREPLASPVVHLLVHRFVRVKRL